MFILLQDYALYIKRMLLQSELIVK